MTTTTSLFIRSALILLGLLQVAGSSGQTVTLVKDINPGSASSDIKDAVALNGKLYFSALGFETVSRGREAWISDGTLSGTVMRDIQIGTQSSDPAQFHLLNGSVHFKAKVPPSSENKGRVMQIPAGSSTPQALTHEGPTGAYGTGGIGSDPTNVTIGEIHTTGRTIYFSSTYGTAGQELWMWRQSEVGDLSIFTAPTNEWRWNGPTLIKDINPSGNGDPQSFMTLNGKTYFTADDGVKGRELWVTDGTPSGTSLLKDIRTGSATSDIRRFVKMGSKLYFVADDGVRGQELWCTDGTTAGTVIVKDIDPVANAQPTHLTVWKDKLYFAASDGRNGNELWCSDGTAAGTTMVHNISQAGSSSPRNFSGYWVYGLVNGITMNKSYLAFSANDGTNGDELWRTDGTRAGTVLLKDLNSGPAGSSPSEMYALNTSTTPGMVSVAQYFYYSAIGGTNGRELWEFNALANTHKKVSPAVSPNADPLKESGRWPCVSMGNALYFYANYDSNGGELWKVSRP